jgi:tRNA threonylcarbamoyladenosine biosynthesis protein TsaE
VTRIIEVASRDSTETEQIGRYLGGLMAPGDVLALYGELGTGKTVLVKGLAASLGVTVKVGSPSFTIICEYEGKIPLYHIDLFRVSTVDEVLKIGYEEYLYGAGVCAIEWAEKMERLLPERRLDIHLYHTGESTRRIELVPKGTLEISLPDDLRF